MAAFQQLAQGTHQLGDVVKVQAGGGFVEQEQRAFFGDSLCACGRRLGGLGQRSPPA
jgi:hypothetical protein